MQSSLWRPRAVIIHRDDNGFGLTVSGDNPVSVQTIKRGGAAECAGIREGDIIIKVNGTTVEHMNHPDVVQLILSAGPYVTLTVRPNDMIGMPGVGLIGGNGGRPHHVPTHERVTAPLPVDPDVQMQMQGNKLRTLQVYRDQAAAEVEKSWRKFNESQSPRDKNDFEKAEKNLRVIEAQMKTFRQSSPNLQLHSPTPFNPYPQSHQPVAFQPFHGGPAPPHFPPNQGFGAHQQLPSSTRIVPGQQMNRNRNPLSAQSSVPSSFANQRGWDPGDVPPPLPPRSFSSNNSFSNPPDPPFPTLPGYSVHDPLHQGNGTWVDGLPNTNADVLNNKPPTGGGSSGGSSHSQQHHRAKSSPDPVSMQKALDSEASKRSDSVSDLSRPNNSVARSRSSVAGDSLDSSITGSPPPPYGKYGTGSGGIVDNENFVFNNDQDSHWSSNMNSSASGDFSQLAAGLTASTARLPRQNLPFGIDIMSMDEDVGSPITPAANQSSIPGKHGPYSSLSKLIEHNAHLAVFMNYVIDMKLDTSSLLFYLITGLYIEEGTMKEMKRWGYEIHSTFTAPGSPLHISNVDENIAAEIDDGLLRDIDREEMMRRLFRKARNKAKEEINRQLEEFNKTRTAGMGSMFGPPDAQLEESYNDKAKEIRIVETYLLPRLEFFYEEYERNQDDRTLALINGISTVLQRQFGLRNPTATSVLEKCASFVSRDKSIKKFIGKTHKKQTIHNGHHFIQYHFCSYTECNICCKLLWGVGPQGSQCADCNMNVHRGCINHVQENCVGSEPEGNQPKKKDRLRQFKDKIRPQKSDPKRRSSNNPLMKHDLSNHSMSSADFDMGDRSVSNSGNSSVNLKNDRRPDTLSEERLTNDGRTYEDEEIDPANHEPRRASNAVGRSESCKERVQRKQTRERRKHSDPSLTKSNDVDLENQRHLSDANHSGSSSNSSLSASRSAGADSPSSSLELVHQSGHHSSSSLPGRNSETPETTVGHGALPDYKTPQSWEGDSDIEIEQDPPDWTKNVPDDVIASMTPREKKRQEVLNELLHTERSHVRNIKVLDRLFHRPIRYQQHLPAELVQMLFGNLEEMLEIHGQFNAALKKKKKENPLIGDIGPVLLEVFDGETAENFKKSAACYCSRQQIGLKALKEKREKNPKLNAFLSESEQEPVCRRLQIQDMIPMAMQRLTKYPLIFENLYNCTDPDTTLERQSIQKAVDMSKEILNCVNYAKKEAEDYQRLVEIQRRIDRSSLEKGVDKTADLAAINELKNLDITKHKLVFEGHLQWRMKYKQKNETNVDVLLLLLHDIVVLLIKQDERYLLKLHVTNSYPQRSERIVFRPVIKLNNMIHRSNASSKSAFILINVNSSSMYDLVCSSPEERKQWLHQLTKATEDFRKHQQESRHPNSNIPPPLPETDERNKETEAGENETGSGPEPSPVKDSITAPENNGSPVADTPVSPDSTGSAASSGDGKLSAGGRSVSASASPSQNRKIGEFLRVTETPPLIEPSEVVVATRDVQFAQPVVSQYEELKRMDWSINKALEDKLKLASNLIHIPSTTKDPTLPAEENSVEATPQAKDVKELVVACMQKVDQLGRILANQKITSETIPAYQEQTIIQQSLNNLLTQLLSEVHRKDEELESRRQELHRVREQNHGYQQRLQSLSKTDRQTSPVNLTGLSSPTLSPTHSRPNSFLSVSSSSEHHEDEPEVVMMKDPCKPKLSVPVASSNSNNSSNCEPPLEEEINLNSATEEKVRLFESACELAPEEFADALEEIVVADKPEALEIEGTGQSIFEDSTKVSPPLPPPPPPALEFLTDKDGQVNSSEDVKTGDQELQSLDLDLHESGQNVDSTC